MPVTSKDNSGFDPSKYGAVEVPTKEINGFDPSKYGAIEVKKKSGLSVNGNGHLEKSSPTILPSESTNGVDVKAAADENKAANPKASEFDSFNPIDLANESDKLSKQIIRQESTTPMSGGVDIADPTSVKQSKKINDYLASNNINPKEINRVFGDMPDAAYEMTLPDGSHPQSKTSLFSDFQANPIDTENKVNNIKTQFALKNAGNDAAGNYFMTLQGTPVNTINEYYNKVKNQQQIIGENLTGEERDKALQRLQETSAQNINATTVAEEYNQSPLKSLVSADGFAGLETLRLFNPNKYQQAIGILSTKPDQTDNVPYKGSDISQEAKKELAINQQIGQETIRRQLLDIGRNNAFTKLTADQYNLNEAYKNTDDPNQKEQISNQYFDNQQKINGLKTDAQADDNRFKLTANLKFDNQAKEMLGQAGENMLEYGAQRFGKGFVNTANTAEDLLTSLFGSDESNAKLQMERLGQTQSYQSKNYLPANLTGAETTLKASKELKDQADVILKGRDISDLSPEETNQLRDLVARNPDQITTVSNDKGKNFLSKATGYKIAGFTGDVASFMAQTAALGGLGMGAKAAELTTLFNTTYSDAYNEATAQGMTPSLANQYALLHGGVMALAGAVSSKYDAVKGMLGESKSQLGKEIAGIGEEGWNAIVNDKLPLLKKIANSAKSVIGENVKMIGTYGVGTSIVNDLADKGVFNKPISNDEIVDHALQSAKDMAIGSMALAGAGFFMHLAKEPITFKDKAMFWENGTNPDIAKAKIDEAIANNELTKEQGTIRKKAIDNMANIIQKVPTKNDRGKDLTDNQRIEYGYNLFLKDKAKEAVSDLPPSQSEDAEHAGLVSEYKNDILLEQPTDKQLESRKNTLEKQLTQKGEDGKLILNGKELAKVKAQLEAVNSKIDENQKTKNEVPKPTEKASITNEGTNKVEQPTTEIKERTPEEIKQISRESLPVEKIDKKVSVPDYESYNGKELKTKKVRAFEARDEFRKRLKDIENIIKCL